MNSPAFPADDDAVTEPGAPGRKRSQGAGMDGQSAWLLFALLNHCRSLLLVFSPRKESISFLCVLALLPLPFLQHTVNYN